ncbi:hypothetical protein AO390_04075 [Pseudomonas marginalis ICMP 11289]|nr:hypothetical protein AO390_04075 [Pseudomonas marginalis ICMP 11289]
MVFLAGDRGFKHLLWLTLALFLSYLCVAMSLPVTSIFVSTELGSGGAWAGLAVGISFGSTIFTRGLAGLLADQRGGKYCMSLGLGLYALAGVIGCAASWQELSSFTAYAVLIVSRLILGVGESLTLVGVLTWGFGLMGSQRSGKVLSLVGIGLYGAFALGSPVGVSLYEHSGLFGVMATCTVMPLIGILMVYLVAGVDAQPGARTPFWNVIGRIWEPGLALCLAGVGSAAIAAFMPLYFLSEGWAQAGLGLSCFGIAFVLVRILYGSLPDRMGSVSVALVSTALEALGLCLLWLAPSPMVAFLGCFLTGLGCSLMFPAMGLEVIKRVPIHLRGSAAGGLAAFQDLSFGLTGPIAGLVADQNGFRLVFLIAGAASAGAFLLVTFFARHRIARV